MGVWFVPTSPRSVRDPQARFRARMKTRAGRNVLKARRARGRKVLSA